MNMKIKNRGMGECDGGGEGVGREEGVGEGKREWESVCQMVHLAFT